MKQDILTKLFAEELGEGYETVNQYYGSYIEEIEEPDDIKEFAETLAEELRQDYGGELSEDERSKFHYALMFNSMTIAYKRMMKHQIQEGEEEEEFFDEDELDDQKFYRFNSGWFLRWFKFSPCHSQFCYPRRLPQWDWNGWSWLSYRL